jgi:hypothetical protein
MPKTYELRNLRITKIALVRKGYRPVNDGARITIVKAEKEDVMSKEAAEASVLERISKAFAKMLGEPDEPPGDPPADPPAEPGDGDGKDDGEPTTVDIEKAVAEIVDAKLKPITDQLEAIVSKSESISKAVPTDEHLAELVKAQVEPLVKAWEDFAVAFNREPKTPNVTEDIPPGGLPAAATKVAYAKIKDMEYGDAVRTLLHGQS